MSKIINGSPLPNMPWQENTSGALIWRYSQNPIIGWNPTAKSARIFNSAVLPYKGEYVGVFRSDHTNGNPQLHVGYSKDALSWDISDGEIQWVDENGESFQPGYAYDPRLVKIEDTYYIIWCTAFGGPALGLGMTKDFKSFTRLENITTPFNRNGVLFPRKINGNFVLLNRPSDNGHTAFGDIYLSESPDMKFWGKHRRVMTKGTGNWWEGTKIGPGPIPIETDEGWLMIYHGVFGSCNGFVYSIGAALLDIDNPSKVLYRMKKYLLTPEMPYETTGCVPNVCFPCAILADADTGRIAIYYGAADTYTAVAFTQLDTLIAAIKDDSNKAYGDDLIGR